jgi:hypothetical protein
MLKLFQSENQPLIFVQVRREPNESNYLILCSKTLCRAARIFIVRRAERFDFLAAVVPSLRRERKNL